MSRVNTSITDASTDKEDPALLNCCSGEIDERRAYPKARLPGWTVHRRAKDATEVTGTLQTTRIFNHQPDNLTSCI
jgi:hypothetical protein